MPEDKKKKPKRTGWIRLLRWLLFSLCGLILFLVLLWGALQTRWAKDHLARLIETVTADAGDYRIKVKKIDGLLPFSLSVQSVTLSGPDGAWLEAQGIDFSWKVQSLLSGVIDVEWFRMDSLTVSRLPVSEEKKPETKSKENIFPSLPRIVLQELEIKRINLAKEVAGSPMVYSLQLKAETENRHVKVSTVLQDLKHANDALHLKASYGLENRDISVELTYFETKGGLVSGLMDLADAGEIQLAVKANGKLAHIKGNMSLEVVHYGKTSLDFQVGLDEISAVVDGRIQVDGRIIPDDLAKALGGLDVKLHCGVALSPSHILEVKDLTLGTVAAKISLTGTADLTAKTMDMKVQSSGVNISPFLRGTGIAIKDLGPVQGFAKGPFSNPHITVKTVAGALNLQGAEFHDMALEVDAGFLTGFVGITNTKVSVTARQIRIPQAPGIKGPLQINLSGTTPDFTAWDIHNLHVSLPHLTLQADRMGIDTKTGKFSSEFEAQIDRIKFLLPSGDPAMDGHLIITARAGGNYQTQEMVADLKATLNKPVGLPPIVMEAIGQKLSLRVEASMKKEVIQLKQVHMAWKDDGLKAHGWLDTNKKTFDMQYDLLLNKLPAVDKTQGLYLAGDLKSHGRIAGTFEKFTADMELSINHFQVNDLKGENLHVQLKAAGLPETPSGDLDLKGTAMEKPLSLHTGFQWSGKTLTLSETRAKLPGIALKADLQITPAGNVFSGKVQGAVESLEFLETLSGVKAGAQGNFLLQAGGPSNRGGASLDAKFKELKFQDFTASTLDIKAEIDDLEKIHGKATINATNVVLPNTQLDTLQFRARGSMEEATADLKASGTASHYEENGAGSLPIAFSTALTMKKKEQWLFHLNTLKAAYGDLHVTLPHPAAVAMDDKGIALDNLELQTGKGRLQVRAQLKGETVDASARITDLPLDLLEPLLNRDMSGMATISLDLSGPLSDPQVQLDVHVREHKLLDLEGGKPLLLEAKFHSRRDGSSFVTDLVLSGLGGAPFKVDAAIPGHLSLKPFSLDLHKDNPITGKLQGRLDLVIFKSIPDMTGQNIQGLVEVDMGVNGTMNNWALTGGIVLSRGLYENVEQGIILADMKGRIEGKGKAVQLTEFTATDGKSGIIHVDGGITVEPPFPMDFSLSLKKATLLRKEELTSTASGALSLKGSLKRLDLKGEITLDKTEVTIPGSLPPDVVIVPVTEINVPSGMKAEQPSQKVSQPLFLDLTVQIPSRFFVRGRGLDAEFRGQLTATGPADNPVIKGTLDVFRGVFNFLDRKFNVTNGQIAFSGATPPVPFLNITTEVNAGEIDARVSLSGPADAFTLTLSSQPPLPQDEIMANILFGRSVAKLNAFQALQIASSINQIAGGGGPDLMGKTRKLLGIDRLNFSGGDEGKEDSGPSVSVGKYVSEKVYVGVEQDLTDNKQDVVVEVDITPNFSVESKAGSRSGAGLGFNWKYDY